MASSAWKIIPFFPSASIPRTVKFYRSCLHFELGSTKGSRPAGSNEDPEATEPTMCSIFVGIKAAANIYFFTSDHGKNNDAKQHDNEKWTSLGTPAEAMVALGTNELDEYYELLKTEGAVKILAIPEDKPWGYRQFTIEDPDRNRLTFFKFLEGGNPGEDE